MRRELLQHIILLTVNNLDCFKIIFCHEYPEHIEYHPDIVFSN